LAPDNAKSAAAVRRRILQWYRRNGRSFLWRHTTDPYTILLSEIMLQQTQAARVEEKLPAFLKEFPTLRKLAKSTTADVVRAWRGMGYNNRAVRLRDLARAVIERHRGTLPDDPAQLDALPGIGRYTAHAVACFAFRKQVPVVDVNIHRLFSRLFWRMKDPSGKQSPNAIWDLAERILPDDAWTWNQSVMELGSTICTAGKPGCSRCPVREYCPSVHLENARLPRAHALQPRKPEPSYDGIPRRLWRGRMVEALRNAKAGRSMSLQDLGKAIKPDFNPRELVWLTGLVDRLAEDGIVTASRSPGKIRIALSPE
jgi:A/G-specific adenine glycosylase